MAMHPESGITISGKSSLRNVCWQSKHCILYYETLWPSHIRMCSVCLYSFKKGHPAIATTELSAATSQAKWFCLLIDHWIACCDFMTFFFLFFFLSLHLFSVWVTDQRNLAYCRFNFWHFSSDRHSIHFTHCTKPGYSTIRFQIYFSYVPKLFCRWRF